MDYRSEIDGLRAIAVVPVILFHASFQPFSGGFIGVDVFFVISGYLITSIIIAEKQAGTFSLVHFYERRARRILPALFFILLTCLPFAWFWMSPDDLKRFSEDLAAVSVFASNFEFLRESGYFDTDAGLKPLLHTWSLAVEEQFYLLFPIFFILFWQLGIRWMIGLLIAAAIISLGVADWGSVNHPYATFYLLPTRGWELLVGAFAALFIFFKPKVSIIEVNQTVSELAAFAGIALIAYAIFEFDGTTPYPSVYTLIPTLGTALLILFATQKTVLGRLLGCKLLMGVGLISYSAYLWHQPLFAFARLHSFEEPTSGLFACLAALAIVLAYFTWRYIEQPFRDKRRVGKTTIFASAVFMSTAMFGLGALGYLKNGFYERLSIDDREVLSYIPYDIDPIYRRGKCLLDPDKSSGDFSPICSSIDAKNGSILLWGDSYAAALSFGLRAALPDAVIQYTSSACPPAVDITILGIGSCRRFPKNTCPPSLDIPTRPHCEDINGFVLSEIKRIRPTVVVLHANWIVQDLNVLDQMSKTIAGIKAVSSASKIVVIGNVPRWEPSLPIEMVRKQMNLKTTAFIATPLLADLYATDAKLKSVALSSGASFVSALNALCDKEKSSCLATAPLHNRFQPLTWDVGHLTEAGSLLLANKLVPSIISSNEAKFSAYSAIRK